MSIFSPKHGETYSCLSPNHSLFPETKRSGTFHNFVGIGKRNKGKMYRGYGDTPQDAILGICTYYRVFETDLELVR